MDIATHALVSFGLQRAFFPRGGWPLAAGMIAAGIVPDIDSASALFGPSAYTTWHRTYTHSLVGFVFAVFVGLLVTQWLDKKKTLPRNTILIAAAAAVLTHLLLDLGQSDGITLFWPLTGTRFAADLFPAIDLWLLLILIAAIAIPELFRLIGSEIGAKDKNPRGRYAALVAFVLVVLYAGARYALHLQSLTLLDSSAYQGESPRRVTSFADSLSPLTWHGIVETQSMLCLVDVPGGANRFNAESAACQHKPEPSPALSAASNSAVVRKFVEVARYPRATVEKTANGYEVVLRAMRDAAEGETRHRVAARVELDQNSKVHAQELLWADQVHTR